MIEFFNQDDVGNCMLTIEAENGIFFNDFAVHDESTIAIALQDG